MTYCREGHTLLDNESEDFRTLVPGVFFEIDIDGNTFFGIVDEYTDPEEFTFLCRLYTDAGRTILLTTPLTLAVPYDIRDFVGWLWEAKDIEQDVNSSIGTYVSNEVTIRDDTGVWVGEWIGEPRTDDTIQYNFRGSHSRFKAPVSLPQAVEVAGAGLGAGDYSYCIVALDGSGKLGAGSRLQTVTLAGAANIFLSWNDNNQVASWNIYGRIGGTIGLLATVLTNSYTDDGTDVPNTGFKPPLFEDPAWTPVEATLDSAGTEGIATFSTTGDPEVVSEKQDDGTTISTFTAVGVSAYDDGVTGDFDLNGLVSTTGAIEDVVINNLFKNEPPPAIGTVIELNYVTHVFIDDDGNKVIYNRDEKTGQQIEVKVFADDGTLGVTLTNANGDVFIDVIEITDEVIPEVGSVNVNVKYKVTGVTAEGKILARENHVVNSYQATPIAGGGVKQVLVSTAGGAPNDMHVRISSDKLSTFDVDRRFDTDLTFLSSPGLHFVKGVANISVLEDWKVVFSNSGIDFSFHWTQAPNWDNWFEDIAERVTNTDILDEFQADVTPKEMVDWASPFGFSITPPRPGHRMVRCANGALFVYNPANLNANRKGFSTFWPETGDFNSFTFTDPKAPQVIVWPEKNKLFATGSQSILDPPLERGLVYSYDISNNPLNPITNEQLVYTMTGAPSTNHLFFGCADDRIWVVSESTFTMSAAHATLPDFSDVLVSQYNPSTDDPANNELGFLPESRFQYTPDLGYIANWRDAGGTVQRTFQSVDGISWSSQDHALGFYNAQTLSGRNGAGSNYLGSPWDGATRYTPHGGTNDTFTGFRKQNVNLVDQGVIVLPLPPVPSQPGPIVWDKPRTLLQPIDEGGVRSARDVINVEMRSPFAPVPIIPLDVARPPPPRQIADPNKAYVYSSRNTQTYNTEFRTSKQIVDAASRGGEGNAVAELFETAYNITNTSVVRSDVAPEFVKESVSIGF